MNSRELQTVESRDWNDVDFDAANREGNDESIFSQCKLFQTSKCPDPKSFNPNCGVCEIAISDHEKFEKFAQRSGFIYFGESFGRHMTRADSSYHAIVTCGVSGNGNAVMMVHHQGSLDLLIEKSGEPINFYDLVR